MLLFNFVSTIVSSMDLNGSIVLFRMHIHRAEDTNDIILAEGIFYIFEVLVIFFNCKCSSIGRLVFLGRFRQVKNHIDFIVT